MSSNPIISVITPAYNCEKTIAFTIDSVLAQTFKNFELIIVDDGSTDNTSRIVSQYSDQRIVHIYQENKERAEARNRGIKIARGQYIAFLDSDDTWTPNKLTKQVFILEHNLDFGMVYCRTNFFNNSVGRTSKVFSKSERLYRGKQCLPRLLKDNFIFSPTPLIRKSVFDKVGLFKTSFIPIEDWEMWTRISAEYIIDYIDEPLANYRIHPKFTSWLNVPDLIISNVLKMIDNIERLYLPQGMVSTKALNAGRSMAHYNYGRGLMAHQKYSKSVKHLIKSIKFDHKNYKAYIRLLQSTPLSLIQAQQT